MLLLKVKAHLQIFSAPVFCYSPAEVLWQCRAPTPPAPLRLSLPPLRREKLLQGFRLFHFPSQFGFFF